MSQFRTGRLAAAVLATAVLVVAFGAAGVARADIISVTLHETGFADMTFSTPSNPASTGTGGTISFGDFMVNVSASSLTSDPTTARLSTTQISVQDTDTGSLAHELTITTKATPYAAPTGDPLALQSSLSESFLSVRSPFGLHELPERTVRDGITYSVLDRDGRYSSVGHRCRHSGAAWGRNV